MPKVATAIFTALLKTANLEVLIFEIYRSKYLALENVKTYISAKFYLLNMYSWNL